MNVPERVRSQARRLTAAVAGAALAAALTGCGWRAETEPPVWPSPNAVTLERDAAALREYQITVQLAQLTAGTPYFVTLSSIEARVAPAHLDALGGVYVAYPEDEIPVVDQSFEQAIRAARDGAFTAAAHTDDSDLAALLISIGLSHSLALWYSSVVSALYAGVEIPPGTEHVLPEIPGVEQAPLVPDATALDAQAIMDFAVAHDQARYLYETIAARSLGAERDAAHARSEVHRARGDALVALAGIAGIDDQRQAIYSLTAASVTGPQAQADTARLMEQSLGARYATTASTATGADRPWLANAAFDAYAASALLPGFTIEEFPVFPGLTVS